MAQSDIKYSNVSIDDEQETGNPDPIAMFKTMFGSKQQKEQQQREPLPANNSVEVEVDDLESAGNSQVELKPIPGLNKLQGRYEQMTECERRKVDERNQRMEAMIQERLQKMSPEEREEFEKKQEILKIAIASQMQPNMNLAMPGMVPVKESPEEVRDREILFAVRSGQVDVLDSLLKKHKVEPSFSIKTPRDDDSHPILHWAALNDQVDVIQYLIDSNVDIDQRNPRGEVALHWASLNGNLRTVHILIENGCDRTASDARGYSAMHHAAQFGRIIIIACLLRRGLHIDVRDNHGRTPLHWAAYKGEDACAEWLLEHGANVAAEDFEQCLPIHWAALQGLYSVATVLVQYGQIDNLKKVDRTGGTPSALAREKQDKYPADSFQHKSFRRVADYLDSCAKLNRDTNKNAPGTQSKHPTWYAWPIMAPLGFWQYYTWVLPETFFYSTLTLIFWVFYWGEWYAWTSLQLRDPGYYVIKKRKPASSLQVPCFNKSGSSRGYSQVSTREDTRVRIDGADDDDADCASTPNPNQSDSQYYRDLYFEVLDKGLLVPVCTSCEIVKPLRSKHDRFTNACISRFDHFCPFMGVAIGARNYRDFFFAMFNATITMYVWLYLSILYTSTYNRSQGFWANFWELLWWELFAWSYAPIAIYGTLMVGQHVMFIKQNLTTNEVINRFRYRYLANKQNPFDQGTLGNVMEFFGFNDQRKVDIRAYYEFYFAGRSEEVEGNNMRMKASTNAMINSGDGLEQTEHHQNPIVWGNPSNFYGGHGHSFGGHGHSHGGHGHSHGSGQCTHSH